MSLFGSILQGLEKKIIAKNEYKQSIIDCIRDTIGITLSPDAIVSCKDGILRIQTTATVKMAMLLKKDLLIANFQKNSIAIHSIR